MLPVNPVVDPSRIVTVTASAETVREEVLQAGGLVPYVILFGRWMKPVEVRWNGDGETCEVDLFEPEYFIPADFVRNDNHVKVDSHDRIAPTALDVTGENEPMAIPTSATEQSFEERMTVCITQIAQMSLPGPVVMAALDAFARVMAPQPETFKDCQFFEGTAADEFEQGYEH